MEVQWKFHVTPNRVIFVQKKEIQKYKGSERSPENQARGGELCL